MRSSLSLAVTTAARPTLEHKLLPETPLRISPGIFFVYFLRNVYPKLRHFGTSAVFR